MYSSLGLKLPIKISNLRIITLTNFPRRNEEFRRLSCSRFVLLTFRIFNKLLYITFACPTKIWSNIRIQTLVAHLFSFRERYIYFGSDDTLSGMFLLPDNRERVSFFDAFPPASSTNGKETNALIHHNPLAVQCCKNLKNQLGSSKCMHC